MTQADSPRWTRRDMLGLSTAAAAAAALSPSLARAAKKPAKASKKIPVALQLYSVRGDCKKDFVKTLQAVAKMGYEGVEFAGYYGWDRRPKEFRTLLDDCGLKVAGTHTGLNTLLGDALKKTVDLHKTLGNKFLIVPGLPGKYRKDATAWADTAKLFNEIAAKLRPQGMRVGYHNHSIEFKPMDGKRPWDIFFGNTDKDVVMQLDTGNALHGGGIAVDILKQYPGRAGTVHMKEAFERGKKGVLGEGVIPWKDVITLIRKQAATEWFIIEQESYPFPPLETAQKCLAGLKKILADMG